MSLLDVTRTTLRRSIDLYDELVSGIDEPALAAKLPGIRSNTVGQQLWCVIGARESYSRAIVAGEWSGFSCSLAGARCTVKSDVAEALHNAGAEILAAVSSTDTFTDRQHQLVLDILEHEAAHHGQLIRYLYALKLPIPEGWKSRYSLG